MEEVNVVSSDFPALSCCVLIESRFSSRRSICGDLKASQLFQLHTEAESVTHASSILRSSYVDACVIGPSVNKQTAEAFIKSVSDRTTSPDCAFIALIAGETNDYIDSPVHAVTKYPCSKSLLTSTLVNGVIRANANSPWVEVRMKLEQGESGIVSISTDVPPSATIVTAPEGQQGSSASSAINIQSTIAKCNSALARLTSGTFLFKPDGAPSLTTRTVVAEVVEELCPSDGTWRNDEKRAALEASLFQFLRDMQMGNPREAKTRLYEVLVHLFSGQSG